MPGNDIQTLPHSQLLKACGSVIPIIRPILATSLLIVYAPQASAEYFLTSDTPSLLGGRIWEPNEIVRNNAGTFSLERALPAGAPLDATHRMDSGDWLVSFAEPSTIGAVIYDPRDLLRYDGSTFTLLLDGALSGIPLGANLDAVFLDGGDAGDLIVSFDIPVTIAGATYEPSDLVRFDGLGFSVFFDASAAAPPIPLSTNLIEADARGGTIFLSFDVPTTLGAVTYMPGQVVAWDGATFGVRFTAEDWPEGTAMTGLALGSCLDGDGDGFGIPGEAGCSAGVASDCDDLEALVFPAAPQVCGDSLNNDCSDIAWPGLAGTNEGDDDMDTFTECGGDCDDAASTVYPMAFQICFDALNNNCLDPGWPGLAGTNEADDDGDSYTECAGDCSDAEAGAFAAPGAIIGLEASVIPGGFRFTWTSQAATAGIGTVYDAFSGSILALGPTGDYSTGTCSWDDIPGNTFDALGPVPPPGDAIYFIFRAQNICGTGTYGDANRDATSAASSSPCG